jgi:hypothetical protein
VPSREWLESVGVVFGFPNPFHRWSAGQEGYHEAGGCRRRHYAFRQLV